MCDKNKRPLKAVIFDMDGLMFDSERIVQRSWNKAGDILGIPALGENIYHTLGLGAAKRRQYFESRYPDFPFETFTGLSRKFFSQIVEEEGLPEKEGLKPLLHFLRKKGILMAVATSSRRSYALDNLNRAGITEYFQGIISGDMVSETKPAPEIYRKACALIGSLPEQSLALEDALNGILSARQAGLIPILIPDLLKEIPEADTLAETRLPSLSDVISYIETHFYSVSTAIKSS